MGLMPVLWLVLGMQLLLLVLQLSEHVHLVLLADERWMGLSHMLRILPSLCGGGVRHRCV